MLNLHYNSTNYFVYLYNLYQSVPATYYYGVPFHTFAAICQDHPPLVNGVITYDPDEEFRFIGTVATYTCNEGFTYVGVNTSSICLTGVVELGGGEFVVFIFFSPPATSCIRKLSITYIII